MSRQMPIVGCVVLSLVAACGAPAARADSPPEGYSSLFDGESLDGWKGGTTADPRKITEKDQQKWDSEVPKHWRVENSEIVNDGHEPHLVTEKDYRDFELWVDWKLSPNGDSGIYLRGCPQVQLWDPANKAAHKHGADKGSGGLWNNERHERFPKEVADKPTGEWNRMYVRMVGERVKVVLNDKLVVDDVVLENYYDRGTPAPASGPIHLQTHGSETRFRNLFVREIPAEEANEILSELHGGEDGFESAFNGKDLSGWTGATDEYEAADGVIRVKEGSGGNLVTERQYDDFIVRLEYKLPPGGNNGLAIRTPNAEVTPASDALELQILDDGHPKYKDLRDYQVHGSVYGLKPAHRGYLRPTGEWNYQETVVKEDHIQSYVNGVKVLDVKLSEAVDDPIDGDEHPGALRKRGHFGFAGHNDPVEFRNIRIKPL